MPSSTTIVHTTIRTLITLLGLISCLPVLSGEAFTFSPITGLNNLSDKGVRSLSQLSDGRMVVVTEGLVHIYDGATFQYMHYNEQKAYPLTGYTGFHHIYTDNDNHLWIKTTHKLLLFDVHTETFVSDLDAYWKKRGINNQVADFFIDADKGMWLLTDKDNLLYQPKGSTTFRTLGSRISGMTGKPDELYDVAVLDNQLYLFYQSGWIICLDVNNGKEHYRVTPFLNRRNPYTNTLMVVPYKQYLYQVRNGDHKGMLNRFDTKNRTWDIVMETPFCLNTLTIDYRGTCWMSSFVGLWKIDADLSHKKLISPLQLVDGSSIETEISAQYTDRQGGLWVGTFNRGLLYYHPNKGLFSRIDQRNFPTENTSKPATSCFSELNGTVLVGTANGLFEQPLGKNNLRRYTGIPSTIQCNALLTDSRQRIWVCTQRDGLYEINHRQVQKHAFPFACLSLFESKTGLYYLCTDTGFGVFNPQTGTFQPVANVKQANLGAVTQLVSFGNQSLLGLSTKGLFLFNTHTQQLTFPTTGKQPLFVHPNQQYTCLFKDSRGWIWFGTRDGLNIYQPDTNTSRIFHQEDGLISNSIRGIAEEASGSLWISTSNGISRMDIATRKGSDAFFFSNFDRKQGVMESEFTSRSIYITSNQWLLCGGPDGFNSQSVNRNTQRNNHTTKPVFTRLLVSGTEIKTGVKYRGNLLLPRSISSTSKLVLNHDQRSITLECSGLNYIHANQTVYRYRLEGRETNWHLQKFHDGIARIQYSELHPGSYRLMVQASNNPTDWQTPFAELTLIVKPTIAGSPFAFVLYVLLLLGGGWYTFTLYRKRKTAVQSTTPLTVPTKTVPTSFLSTPLISSPDEAMLQKVVALIEKNLSNASYSVEQLSKDMFMDRTNLFRKLSTAVGMNPSEFIRSIRLQRAALLLEKGYRVSEVATLVGFSTTSYFSKCFQEMYGVPPSQYRKTSH